MNAMADSKPKQKLEGFEYGSIEMPTGTEWESPSFLSLNKLQPSAYMFHFDRGDKAEAVLPNACSYYQSLDGTWKFHWVKQPSERPVKFYEKNYDVSKWDDIAVPGCWNVQGLQQDGTMKYGVPLYVNQPVMFYHQVAVDDWKKGVMRKPTDSRWTTYEYPNEVGSYRRTFTLPKFWKGRRVIINFDGVDSFFYLWINGKYVGFSKNSRNTASFDITPYIYIGGDNVLAVEVYRSSDGSFLEAQDMFRLPGIFRSTYLTATPEVKISDMAVRTKSISTKTQAPRTEIYDGIATIQQEATITIDNMVSNLSNKAVEAMTVQYSVYPVKLYSDETETAVIEGNYGVDGPKKAAFNLDKDASYESHTELTIPNARLWSAEKPNRYVLVAALKDANGNVLDRVSTYFGICKVEIKDTPASEDEFGKAGRYFYVNGKPVKLKGVNRHETNPSVGHAITHGQMEQEVMLMKQGNINHIRMSHYSNDPYMYYLCDKYGIYLEDECNLESHEYNYGDASLSHPKEWRPAHIARNMEMVHAHINHPSIVIWSLGNEAGPGDNFKAAYEAIKQYDQSRPIQYERDVTNGWKNVDMGSNQYPGVEWVQWVAKGNADVKYPFHISEYAHSMGNSLGNLQDYWDAIESTNFFCGGAIWDWVDQAIDAYTKDGTLYMGYGGDHGDWPNDGMFCMNGIMLPDLKPKPQYFEVKKVYQNVGVRLKEIQPTTINNRTMVRFSIFNKNYFEPLDNYQMVIKVLRNGEVIKESTPTSVSKDNHYLAARDSMIYNYPVDLTAPGEYYLNIEFRLKQDMPWAEKGYVQMDEQLFLCNTSQLTDISKQTLTNTKTITLTTKDNVTTIVGNGFTAKFDNTKGSLNGLQYNGQELIKTGVRLDAFRAPVDNDNWAWNQWFQNGLLDLKHKATAAPVIVNNADGSISISYNVISQAPNQYRVVRRPGKAGEPFEKVETGREMTADDFHFTTAQCYTIYPDGTISLSSSIVSSDPGVNLPRLGYTLRLPREYNQYTYYGRGPLNNYADRKTGSFVGIYKSTVQEQFVNFPKPQSMGNREDVRWCVLTDASGHGVQFISQHKTMSTSALPWSAQQMAFTAHPHELPTSIGTYLHLDCQVTGLGGNSCGQGGPLEADCTKGALHQMTILIRPVTPSTNYTQNALVTSSNRCPVTIVRDPAGKVTVQGDAYSHAEILYTINGGKEQTYTGTPIDLKQGGTVSAWYKGENKVKNTATFSKIEKVPVTVVYVSSEEGPGGDLASNMVDGDPNTIWHTMYSITVGTYPHWVDFDCSETKTIKGFTYLPRQDGPNGNIKGYKVQLSMDGKTWGNVVAEGNFENNMNEKKVTFKQPQKARYLRFTATSSQNGAEYASGAEFGVLAE